MEGIVLLVNPAAGRGGIRARLPQLLESFRARGVTKAYHTAAAGDEETLAATAIREGAKTIVAVGGDGTCSRIANAILSARSACRLAVVAAGTGNDFAKTLGVDKHSPEQIAELISVGRSRRMDVGFADRYFFLNSCGFGFDSSVLEASNNVRFLKGNAVYIYAALRQLFTYRGVSVGVSGAPGVRRDSMLMVTVSNGRFLGGAFKIAPRASVTDGKLDACFFSDSNVIERVRLFIGAMRGTHVGMRSVKSASIDNLTLTFPARPSMEVDGELRQAKSKTVEARCIPRALSVFAAPGALS